MRNLITLLLALILASVAWSQDAEESGDKDATATEVTEEADDSDLDEQGYAQEDEDDFIPSEEVSADQSLTFPTDI